MTDAMIRDTHEHQDGDDLAIKIRLDEPAEGLQAFRDAGERVAQQNSSRAPRIWVWTYAHDMDLMGPAICISYVGPDNTDGLAITEFFDPKTLLTYYSLKSEQLAMLRDEIVPEGMGD